MVIAKAGRGCDDYDISDAGLRLAGIRTDSLSPHGHAGGSVPSNIAEGQARYSRREFYHFLNIARGSLAEVETQILLANDLGYLGADQTSVLVDKSSELGRILNGLIAATKSAA